MALREEMLTMLDSTSIEECCCEISGDLLVSISLARINNSNVYILAENDLHTYVRILKSWGVHVHKVVCIAPKEFQKVDDVEIISPQELMTDMTPRKFFFVVMDICQSDEWKTFIRTRLNNVPSVEMPNKAFAIMQDNAHRINTNSMDGFDENRIYYYQSHKTELMELFDSLADETSKRTLYYYVESYVKSCIYKGEQNSTLWRYFFGGKYERLYKHLDGECWVNCGAFEGDTVCQYLSFNFKPKIIYAFEGNKKSYDLMLDHLSMLPPEKLALVEPINEMIDETTDFKKILAGNKCTLLNADIEGSELKLLHATKDIIQADRPVLAICVYHLKDDLLTVPQFIQSICTDYIYYLRKYTPYIDSRKKNQELIFYAVPKERAI